MFDFSENIEQFCFNLHLDPPFELTPYHLNLCGVMQTMTTLKNFSKLNKL